MDEQTKAIRDEIRKATLGSPATRSFVTVEVNGAKVDVCRPTISQQQRIQAAGEKGGDFGRAMEMLLLCACVPGTRVPVFERADLERLQNEECGPSDFVGKLTNSFKLLNASTEEVEKNSVGAQTE